MHDNADLWISAKPIDVELWCVTVNSLEHVQESDGPPLEVLILDTSRPGWAGLSELDAQLLTLGYRRSCGWEAGTALGWVAHVEVTATDVALRELLTSTEVH